MPRRCDAFVANWCKTLHGSDTEKAKQHQAELLDAIRSRSEIEELATNPVMLTALAALHWNRTRLPDQRTELYQSVLDWLAQAREENRKDLREEATVRMSAVACLAMMEHLAFIMHTDPRGRQTEITLNAAARALAPRFRGLPEDEQFAAAEQFLQEEETDSGILIRRGNTLRFWHLTFQEYLAAKALAGRGSPPITLHGTNPVPRRMASNGAFARRCTSAGRMLNLLIGFFHEILDELGPEPHAGGAGAMRGPDRQRAARSQVLGVSPYRSPLPGESGSLDGYFRGAGGSEAGLHHASGGGRRHRSGR